MSDSSLGQLLTNISCLLSYFSQHGLKPNTRWVRADGPEPSGPRAALEGACGQCTGCTVSLSALGLKTDFKWSDKPVKVSVADGWWHSQAEPSI